MAVEVDVSPKAEKHSIWHELLPTWVLERAPLIRRKRRVKVDVLGQLGQRLFPRHASPSADPEVKEPPKKLFGQRRLSAEELEEIKRQEAEANAKARQGAMLLRQARNYIRIIQDTLERRGVCHLTTDKKGRKVITHVAFHWPPNVNPHFIELCVDTLHWPHGCSLDQLKDPSILTHISHNCKHRVRVKETHDCGWWYVIELDIGATGIPLHVDFKQMESVVPASRANDNMLICLGQTENARPVWVTFPKFVNLKVSGSPESGKSNFLNSMLCWLIRRNSPWQLQFLLVDLKEGMEFGKFYDGLPHLLQIPKIKLHRVVKRKKAAVSEEDGTADDESLESIVKQERLIAKTEGDPRQAIIEDREDLPGALYWLVQESERRMKLLKGSKCKTISEYNQIAHNVQGMSPLSRIILVIDELADVMQDDDIKEYAQRFLQNISNRSRAVGIHAVVCSQHTGRDLLPGRIQQAFRALATFALADRYVSIATTGNQGASKLDNPGRMMWIQGRYELEVQTPYCPNALVEQTVKDAISAGGTAKPLKPPSHDVDDMEIFAWALEHNGGKLGREEIFENFRGRGFSKDQSTKFGQRWEGQQVTIDGACYQVLPAVRFPKQVARRLMAVQDPAQTAMISPSPDPDDGLSADDQPMPDALSPSQEE